MPKHVSARTAQDEREERQVRKLAGSFHAPADWKFHAQMVVESWAGKTPQDIALLLDCHPQTVRIHLNRFNVQGVNGLGMREGAGRKPRLTELERSKILDLAKQPPPGKLERYAETLEARDETGPAQWSLDALTEAAHTAGIQVEWSQIRRIYLREGVRWRETHSWGTSDDKDFVPKEPRSSPTTPNRPRARRPSALTNSGRWSSFPRAHAGSISKRAGGASSAVMRSPARVLPMLMRLTGQGKSSRHSSTTEPNPGSGDGLPSPDGTCTGFFLIAFEEWSTMQSVSKLSNRKLDKCATLSYTRSETTEKTKEFAAMAPLPDPTQERPSTYVVQDRSNPEELRRLQLQERMITLALGGVLPEQPEPGRFSRVLDMACGTGGWLIELAKTVPTISQLVGADISKRVIEAARAEAETQQVQERVTFCLMDALSVLAFEDHVFDLVNLRFATSFLRTWEWPQVLRELKRVTRPGGGIRVTEADLPDQSSSLALLQLCELLAQAYRQAGKYFHPQAMGIASNLASLLEQQDLQQVRTRVYRPEIRAGTVEGQLFCEDMRYLFRTNVPFLLKWTRLPDDYEALYQQMLAQMQQPDFFATNQTITAWGSKPEQQ